MEKISRSLAPIALFTYKRTAHLARTLDALEKCPHFRESRLVVFSDGPKGPSDINDVLAVRSVLAGRRLPNMEIVCAQKNQGLAKSIISGVSKLCEAHGRAIVIEDDLLLQPAALEWFNTVLDKFSDHKSVFHVNGFQYYLPEFAHRREGIPNRFVSSWGWATWRRAWINLDDQAGGWEQLKIDEDLRYRFDQNGSFPLTDMLLKQMAGKLDSWAIRWSWACFKAGAISLSPPRSLVSNIGFDSSATHNNLGRMKSLFAPRRPLLWESAESPKMPLPIINELDQRAIEKALKRTRALLYSRLKGLVGKYVAAGGDY